MRHALSTRLSYRNALVAAALAAGLQIGSGGAGASRAPAVQPHRGDEMPGAPLEAWQASSHKKGQFPAR